jgi:hypothetical protein
MVGTVPSLDLFTVSLGKGTVGGYDTLRGILYTPTKLSFPASYLYFHKKKKQIRISTLYWFKIVIFNISAGI